MNEVARSPDLSARIAEAARNSEQAVSEYLRDRGGPPSLAFSQQVTLALALLAEYSQREAANEDELRLLAEACADAAAACHSQPPEQALAVAAAAFSDTARACRTQLGAMPTKPSGATWRRFVYDQTAVDVARSPAGWHVRAGERQANNRLLDLALEEILSRSNSEIAKLTIQILDWQAKIDQQWRGSDSNQEPFAR
jgi:hypothetical protein